MIITRKRKKVEEEESEQQKSRGTSSVKREMTMTKNGYKTRQIFRAPAATALAGFAAIKTAHLPEMAEEIGKTYQKNKLRMQLTDAANKTFEKLQERVKEGVATDREYELFQQLSKKFRVTEHPNTIREINRFADNSPLVEQAAKTGKKAGKIIRAGAIIAPAAHIGIQAIIDKKKTGKKLKELNEELQDIEGNKDKD